jgi:pilus assembly protein Flp/PilA
MKLTNRSLLNLRFRKGIWFASGTSLATRKDAKLKRIFLKFLANESGATAIEYCLIAAFIALAIIALVNALGINIAEKLTAINNQLK